MYNEMSYKKRPRSVQITYWIPTDIEEKIKATAHNMQVNRQAAITHILKLYYHKDWDTDKSESTI